MYQEQAKPGFELTEYRDLDNPGRRLKPSEMVSDRSSLARAGGPPKDDHRFDKLEDMDAKFAKHIVETVQQVLKDKQMAHLILIAPPKMLDRGSRRSPARIIVAVPCVSCIRPRTPVYDTALGSHLDSW